MNITLSVDEKTAERARAVAQTMGKSLNQAVREFLSKLADAESQAGMIDDLAATAGGGNSGGARIHRDATYADRLQPKKRVRRAA